MKEVRIKRYTRSGEHVVGGVKYQIKVIMGIVERAIGPDQQPYKTVYVSTSYVNGVPYSCITNPLHRTIHEVLEERIIALKEDMDFEYQRDYRVVVDGV